MNISSILLKNSIYRNLKHLNLTCLPGIKNREVVLTLLKNELIHCVITYNDSHAPVCDLKEK